jgi:hypothetical protein
MQEHGANRRSNAEDLFMKRQCAAPRAQFLLSISCALATLALSANVMARDKAVRNGNCVRHPLRDRFSRAFIASILVLPFCAAPPASAEIFKCVAKDATALYQNFPCDMDSLGSLPSNQPVATPSNAPVAKTPSKPGVAGQEKSKTEPIKVASTVKSTYAGEPQIGMSSDEVRMLLGEPEEMVDDEPADGGRISTWRYADGRSVQFDHKHHVFGIQR